MTRPTQPTTFAALLAAHAEQFPERTAMIDRDRPISYAALESQTRALAANLRRIGVRANDRVAVWLPNSQVWLLTFLACARLGATVFAINTRFRAHEVEDIVRRGRTDWMVLWPHFKGIAFADILDGVSGDAMSRVKGIVCYREEPDPRSSAAIHGRPVIAFDDLLSPAPFIDETSGTLADAGALVFTTSGTTSLPKFVLHRQRTLISHGLAVAAALGYDDTTCVLASTPFCGAFGFATLLGALAHGAKIVSDPVFQAAQATARVREQHVTHTYLNDESLDAMLAASNRPDDFASMRLVGYSSFSPAQYDLVERAAARGMIAAGLYGSSELNALAAMQPVGKDPALRPYQSLPGGELVIPDARVRARDVSDGTVLPHGTAGAIEIRSPFAMAGYLDQPDATADAFTADGYFRTGDFGYTVSDRHFVFQSRMSDSLRLSGFLVNPSEIEGVLDTLAGIEASQVVGAADGTRTVAVAFVIRSGDAPQAGEHYWKTQCAAAMASFKVPARIVVLDAFPVVSGPNGVKIQRNRLREMAAQLLAEPLTGASGS